MKIEPDGQGGWRIVRDTGETLTGYSTAGDAATAADALTASAGPADETGDPEVITAAITAGVVDVPARPPAAWFQDPAFGDDDTIPSPACSDVRGCPLTITDDGRVYGHAALWASCHVGFPGECVTPPHSPSGYAYYRVGSTLTADGSTVPTGVIAINTGHAPMAASGEQAVAHYDNTGTAVARVAAGEDQYGIWVAGAIRPGASVAQVEALRSSALSGDWRDQDGALELRGLLAVNTPGFAVPRFGLAASGAPQPRARVVEGRALALVAAGSETLVRIAAAPWAAGDAALAQRMDQLEKAWANWSPVVDPLAAQAARERLTAALEPPVTAASEAANTPGSNYADPGYQKDGKKRYPLDSAAHVRAAASYLGQSANAAKYTAQQLSSMKGKIRSAAKKYDVTLSDSF